MPPPANPAGRPLSPHLTIFRPLMTMMMSIAHRITGAALYVGTALVAWWLMAAAAGPQAFATASAFFGSWIGMLVLLGYSWAVLHHCLGGIRHLIWDTGRGMGRPMRDWLAWATLIGSVSLTALVWAVALLALR